MKYDERACKFNMDTGCVELLLRDGRMISIDCTGVEDELDVTMAQRTELDYLIYNDPPGYADLMGALLCLAGGQSVSRSGRYSSNFLTKRKLLEYSVLLICFLPAVPDTAPVPHPPARRKCPPGCDTRRPERPDLPLPGTR